MKKCERCDRETDPALADHLWNTKTAQYRICVSCDTILRSQIDRFMRGLRQKKATYWLGKKRKQLKGVT